MAPPGNQAANGENKLQPVAMGDPGLLDYSLNCVCSAADLAKGRTPDAILEIDANLIQESVGGLPADHLHCARLAAETLQAALDDFMRKSRKGRAYPQTI